jgi:hypothetical protein
MKINKAVIETVLNYIHLAFEKDSNNLGEFKVLLFSSGVSKNEASEFFCDYRINYQRLEEEIALDNEFFLDLSSNLLPYLLPEQRTILQDIMKRFGYILGVNKQFRKAKKAELVDYDKEDTIKRIEIFKDKERGRFRVAVNDKLLNWTKPKIASEKSYWQYIHEIAKEGECCVGDAERANEVVQWFNSKSKKDQKPIYKYTNLKPTNIIYSDGEYLRPSKGVRILMMKAKKAYENKS